MTTIKQKVDYVKHATNGEVGHHCHWPGCGKAVPPAMWGCKQHWFKLPQALRNRIWATYRPGQEISKTPSAAYLAVTDQVQKWIATNNLPAAAQEKPWPKNRMQRRPAQTTIANMCASYSLGLLALL